MGFLSNLLSQGRAVVRTYSADNGFLRGAVAAAANIIMADGVVDETEITAAISGMTANPILKASFNGTQIENELSAALARAKTRAGRIDNTRAIEALVTRPDSVREDVFLIAADVADDGGIGAEERVVLGAIAKSLSVNAEKLLGE